GRSHLPGPSCFSPAQLRSSSERILASSRTWESVLAGPKRLGGAHTGIPRAPPEVMIGSGLFRLLFAPPRELNRRPRLVRRVGVHCPQDGGLVEVDLLIGRTGRSEVVLRCSAHPGGSPPCDQACRRSAEWALAPARALIVCPRGTGPPEEID